MESWTLIRANRQWRLHLRLQFIILRTGILVTFVVLLFLIAGFIFNFHHLDVEDVNFLVNQLAGAFISSALALVLVILIQIARLVKRPGAQGQSAHSSTNIQEEVRATNEISLFTQMSQKAIGFATKSCLIIGISIPCLAIIRYVLGYNLDSSVIIAFFSVAFLSAYRCLLVQTRIRRDLYGGNEDEAREIIAFILKNSSGNDVGPGNKGRRLISPQDIENIVDAEGVIEAGEFARMGATI